MKRPITLGVFFTGQITAAGKVPPAKVLVIGAGVAGLAAIGAAKSLGAIVRAFDTRPAVKEQVQSMGAEFLELNFEEDGTGSGGYAKQMSPAFIEAEMALFKAQAAEVDIIVTTALIPGKPAPRLITTDMLDGMKSGSVIVDLAAANGGNCEKTEKDQVLNYNGVTIIGYANLPARLATQSSQLYAQNLVHLLSDLTPEKDGTLHIDMEDEVQRGATVVHEGKISWPPPPLKSAQDASQTASIPKTEKEETEKAIKKTSCWQIFLYWIIAGGAMLGLGSVAPVAFISHFAIFVLSVFVGWQVIWNVSHSLHTPLMSVTNAISGIIIVGAIVQTPTEGTLVPILAATAIFVASINIAGGFFVTHRMLNMFRK